MKTFIRFIKGILLKGEASDPSDNQTGSLWYNSTDERFRGYSESAVREIVTEDQSQSISNKTLDNSNIATFQDDNFTLQDDGDNTKQAQFQLSSISTATTRTYTLPDADDTVVTQSATQTLQNKTIDGTDATGTNTVLNDASDVSYDNGASGLTATNAQDAIDEVEGRLDSVETDKLQGPGTHADNILIKTDGVDTNDTQTTGISVDDSNNITGVNNITTLGDITVGGDLTVNGTTTTLNTATLDVEDTNITVNKNGNDASAEGAGLTVERTGTDGSFVYEDALTSKFKIGALGSEVEVADVSSSQSFTNKDMGDATNSITNASADSFTRESGNQQVVSIPDTASPDNFVLEDFTQALTNKDYDGGTASNTSRITVPQDSKSNLDALTRKEGTLVYANDQDKLYIDNGTILTPIGSGSGDLNFYETGDAEIAQTGDFDTGNDATFLNGGTLAGTFSISNTAADLIRGNYSFKYVQSATAGDNDDDYIASPLISVPQGYRGRNLLCKFQYRTDATDGNINVVIWDSTNNTQLNLISDTLDTYDDPTDNTAKEYQLIFTIPSDCEELQFGFQVLTGEANSYLIWDDVSIGPDLDSAIVTLNDADYIITPSRSNMTDWTQYTPTFTAFGTVSVHEFFWRRVGSTLHIQGTFTSGSGTASEARISFPSGLTASNDFTVIRNAGVYFRGAASSDKGGNVMYEPNVSYMTFSDNGVFNSDTVNSTSKANGNNIGSSGNTMQVSGVFEIADWTSDALFLAAIPINETVYVKDIQTSGTASGTFTSGAWQTRTLNTVENSKSWISLSSNQITLQAGTYKFYGGAPGYRVAEHQVKLRNITNSTDDILGTTGYSGDVASNGQDTSFINGQLTITTPTTYELQHQCATTHATDGFGRSANFSVNIVFAFLEITKLIN